MHECSYACARDVPRSSSPGPVILKLILLVEVFALILVLIFALQATTFGGARRAMSTAVRAKLQSIPLGCEMFKYDFNAYPPANPALFGDGSFAAQDAWGVRGASGASLLAKSVNPYGCIAPIVGR